MSNDTKKRDLWDKAEILGKLLSALIIPFALVGISYTLSKSTETREESRRVADRQLEQDRRRIDRANGLIESLSSDSDRKRRLAVAWAGYLFSIQELPSDAKGVLLEVALSDSDAVVAQAAGAIISSAAVGNASLREFAAARFNADPRLRARAEELSQVTKLQIERAEGVVSVPPCHRAPTLPFGGRADCDRGSATVIDVCTGPFSKSATVRAIRVFTKWAGDPRPWEQVEAAIGSDGEWNSFEKTFVRNVDGDNQQVCATFRQWSSHQARDARIEVTFTR